jgi:hypothetical protein
MADVFVCYSYFDRELMHRVCASLHANGLRSLNYDSLSCTDSLLQDVEIAITQVWAIVAISFIGEGRSEWVEREVAIARQLEKCICLVNYTCTIHRTFAVQLEGAYAHHTLLDAEVALERLAKFLRSRKSFERSIMRS